MHTPGTKAVSVAGILLVALFSGCSSGDKAGTDPVSTSQEQQAPFIAQAAVVTGADGIVIDDYMLVSSTRISRTVYEYTYKADVSNWGSGDAAITATLASTVPEITVVQGAVNFGNVKLGATQQSSDTFTIRVDRSKPFNEEAQVWTVQATPLPPTTFELIEQARLAGAINDETALLYKVYYEFRDSRLPGQYVGRDDGAREATAIQDAIEKFGTLSQSTQDLLRPFLLPPDDPASWYQLREVQPNIATVQSTNQTTLSIPTGFFSPATVQPGTEDVPGGLLKRIRIIKDNGEILVYWNNFIYPQDAATASALAAEIDSTIWPKLTALLGAPLMLPGGALEVRLVGTRAMYINYGQELPGILGLATGACYPAIPVVFLNRDVKADFFQTAAHEITHAIQARFPRTGSCGESSWLAEATSTWAEHFVYPGSQTEQPYAEDFMNVPASSLEDTSGLHEYGAYLWFLYMTQGDKSGTVNADTIKVRQVWDALDSFDSLHAINSTILDQGGLYKKWHEFVLFNWNRKFEDGKPYVYYKQWDGLTKKARESTGATPEAVTLNGNVARTYLLPHRVNHLAAKYYHYDFTKDDTIRRIRLYHPYASISPAGKAKVQAIVKIRNKGWQSAEDWTGFQYKTLCRDKPEEDFEELVVVISNGEFDDRTFVLDDDGTAGNGGSNTVATKLQVSALGCSNWKGWVKGSYDSGDPVLISTSTTDTKDVTFERRLETWTDSDDSQVFKVTGGTVGWTHTETDNIGVTCSGNFSGSYGLSNTTPAEAELTLGVKQKPDYSINAGMIPTSSGGSWSYSPYDYLLTCGIPGYQPPATLAGVNTWFSVGDGKGGSLPGIFDNTPTNSQFNGELQGASILHTDKPGEIYNYQWRLQQNGTFSDP